jgi:hypothetical protein
MRRLLRAILVLAILLLSMHAGPAAPARAIFPLRDVRPGQRAVGKSVFRGTKIESFHIEIIGVLRKFEGTRSVILGRILDGPVVTRKSGIIMGMSGSPVYINGRLAGAIALAWSFSKEPITGITPIEDMLQAWQPKPAAKTPTPAAAEDLPAPMRIGGKLIERVRIAPRPAGPDPAGVMTLTPLSGLVQASGFNQRAVKQLSDLLSPYGVQVVAGPAGGEERLRPPLVPGAALGAQLVSGDLDLTGLGTLTLIEGGRVLAFGHSLLELGELNVPMTGGYVYDIMPSVMISEKIMSPTQVVGRVMRDTPTAIAGEVGTPADQVPMTIEVADRDLGRSRQFRLRLARIRELFPSLAATSVMTAVDETRGRSSRGGVRVTIELAAEGRPTIRREEVGYSDGDAAMVAMAAVMRPLAVFLDSPFGKLRLQQVRVRVEAQEERKTATIERVTIAQSRVKAGDEVTLSVILRPYGGDLVEIPVQVKLPADLPRGAVRLVISGGGDADQARGSIGAPWPAPVSLTQLIERYVSQDRRQDLVVQAALPRGGAALLGEELPDLPRGALEALRAVHPTDLRPAASVMKVIVPTEWVLSGRQMVSLSVESRLGAPGPSAPPQPEGPPQPEARPQPSPSPPEDDSGGDDEADLLLSGQAIADSALPIAAAPPAPPKGKPAPQPAAPPKKEEEAKPLTRAPQTWVQQARNDYARAKLTDVAIASDGRLSLGLSRTELGKIPAALIWSIAVREGVTYLGTGTDGVVYRVSADGQVSRFFATGEMNVHALLFDHDGNLCVGTSPRGKLFRVAPDGAGKLWYDADSEYLWCLTQAPDGTIFAGAGSPARVYALRPDGHASVLAALPATNVLSLVRSPGGDLYAGTSDAGVVYRVRPDGSAGAVLQVQGPEVSALALDGKGNVYAAASPSGDIYQIPAQGLPRLFCQTGEKAVYGLALLPGGDLVAATGPSGLLLRVGPDGEPQLAFRPESGVATALAVADGAVYLASSAPALLREFGPDHAPSGTLESSVLETGRAARWGRLTWTAETPEGAAVATETRSGDSSDPDDHWAAWIPAPDGAVVSPPASHLQYRLTLTTKDAKLTPTVREVRLSYQPANRPPTVALKAPAPEERMAKKYTIKWEAQDPDKDTLTYDLAVSRDLGRAWKDVKRGIAELKYDWDTTPTSEGRCLVRVTASDAQSEPQDPQQDAASVVAWVDNTPPTVMLLRSSLAVGDDRRARVTGTATDKLSPLRSVEYRVDTGEWRSLALSAIESLFSEFSVATDPLKPGKHTLEARAFDSGGNVGNDKVEITVKEAAKPSQPAAAKPAPEAAAKPPEKPAAPAPAK